MQAALFTLPAQHPTQVNLLAGEVGEGIKDSGPSGGHEHELRICWMCQNLVK